MKRQRNSVEIFNKKLCENCFYAYTSREQPEILGPEGMRQFCADIGIEPENVLMLVLAYKMGAARMGYFSKKEWVRGLSELQCDSITKLQKKLNTLKSLLNDPVTFANIYKFAFHFSKDVTQSGLETSMAKMVWQILLGESWALFPEFVEFLDLSKCSIISKDLWSNVLDFSKTINNDLCNYDTEEAWPVALDEFVLWLREKRANAAIQTDIL